MPARKPFPARDIYAEVTDAILAKLETGVAPWVRPWNTEGCTTGMIPTNAVSHRPYNGVNVLLLWIAADAKGYKSSEWLTYRQAQGLGGNVRAGERGTMVTLWKPLQFKERDEATGETRQKKVLLLRSYVVFNREQCDGLPVKTVTTVPTTPAERDAAVEAFVKATGARVVEGEREGRAFYSPVLDEIGMPAIARFKDSGAYYATLLHEATHWTGHKDRCNRDLANRFGSEAYAAEELIAELGSAFLSADFGLDGTLQHPEYIGNWIKVLKGDKRAIITAASKAKEAVAFLNGKQPAAVAGAEAEETAETESA